MDRYGRFETYNQMVGRFLSSQVQVRLICPVLQLLAKPDEGTVPKRHHWDSWSQISHSENRKMSSEQNHGEGDLCHHSFLPTAATSAFSS